MAFSINGRASFRKDAASALWSAQFVGLTTKFFSSAESSKCEGLRNRQASRRKDRCSESSMVGDNVPKTALPGPLESARACCSHLA
jgi:hypothetical protein